MTTTATPGDALAPRAPATPDVIRTPVEYRDAMTRWAGHYNVLTAFTNLSGLAVQHGIVASVVQINPDPSKNGPGEVYDGLPFLKGGEVALAKIGLRKIADCGGINTETIRTDPRTIPYYWEVKAIATYTGIDGRTVRRETTVEWDLRDGSPRMKGWTPNQVEEGRKNGLRNCEARAINAAIRECGIKQKYTRQELAKPFLVIRVAFQPDMNDPEQRRLVAEHALRGTAALYPARESAPLVGEVIDAETSPEPRQVGSSAALPPASSTSQPSSPDPNQPPVEGAVRIEKVETKAGETNGRKWSRFIVVDSNGESHSTFDKSLYEAALKFKDGRDWVELVSETNGEYKNLVEIIKAGAEPKLPGMENL